MHTCLFSAFKQILGSQVQSCCCCILTSIHFHQNQTPLHYNQISFPNDTFYHQSEIKFYRLCFKSVLQQFRFLCFLNTVIRRTSGPSLGTFLFFLNWCCFYSKIIMFLTSPFYFPFVYSFDISYSTYILLPMSLKA